MVKNDGGNKGKGLARKHVSSGGSNKQLRVAVEDGERYAVVSKMLGNGMCYVRLLDGSTGDRLCIIRNKFKGRGKRDNILDSGSWVLIGMREWASKQDTCDLLEVYNHGERDRLMKNEPCFKSVTAESDADSRISSSSSSANAHSTVQFTDSATLKYSHMVKGQDDDDDDLVQQRAYDMPTSSDDDDDDDDDEDDDEEDDEDDVPVPVPAAALKPKLKVDHINVDDI
jgi:initiation factor 1A